MSVNLQVNEKEIMDKVVKLTTDKLVDMLLGEELDERIELNFAEKFQEKVKEAVTAKFDKYAQDQIFPTVAKHIDDLILKPTNSWGVEKGPDQTLQEYLIERANEYFHESVDHHGHAGRGDRYFKGDGTRLSYQIGKNFTAVMEHVVKDILKNANESLAKSIQDVVTVKLREIVAKIKVQVPE